LADSRSWTERIRGGFGSEARARPAFSPPVPLESLIVSDFPEIFAEFRGKQFSLLWRGSRDGFEAPDFHSRCDGHAPTLTVLLDTKGNVFGGFTPVEWDSIETFNTRKADDGLRSFIFTLKNPHNIPARRFALKSQEKGRAIKCNSKWGPCFGRDIYVSEDCSANPRSYTSLGIAYTNDTGLEAKNRSLPDHRLNGSSKQIPLAGEGEIPRQILFCRRTSASEVPVRGTGWRERAKAVNRIVFILKCASPSMVPISHF
jgi:hypothetical protein